MTTIEERVQNAMHDLSFIIAGLGFENPDKVMGEKELHQAMTAAAVRAQGELYWLTLLPADVLDIEAPTTDEREAQQEAGGVR